MPGKRRQLDRRQFLKETTVAAAALGVGVRTGSARAARREAARRRVIVLGVDGMDPGLTEKMMDAGELPNLATFRRAGGYRRLGTSTPPQSPVAWANFINGAGTESHAIFDFIHRDPSRQCAPYYSAAETIPGDGSWEVGDHRLQLTFWPFKHRARQTVLRRRGTPFWQYLDEAGISSAFYDLPSNYPPSPSEHGHHCCLSGMGVPDMLGTYGTYQYFAEDAPSPPVDEAGGRRSRLVFENHTARAELIGPRNYHLKQPTDSAIQFLVHRDGNAQAAMIEVQGKRILLRQGQWSSWVRLDFVMAMPSFVPDRRVSAICRFYLQQVGPVFRLYVSPANVDPSDPAVRISEPANLVERISDDLGLFYTTGFQEDHKALTNEIFDDEEFAAQAEIVLQERLRLLDYAVRNYDDGLLFFYFSSTDLQAHMFWWDRPDAHPRRTAEQTQRCHARLRRLYRRIDQVIGDVVKRYGDEATIMALSDHGFASFKRQFNLNTWLHTNGYIQPWGASSVLGGVDWDGTQAYGLGLNGLYVNLRGRERDGIVEPGQRDALLTELTNGLLQVRDANGEQVIHSVRRVEEAHRGEAANVAPDLIVGYARGYRASWATCLGEVTDQMLSDNDSAWAADHCVCPEEVPGVLFCNRTIAADAPSLCDLAPTILDLYGLGRPDSMTGRNILPSPSVAHDLTI